MLKSPDAPARTYSVRRLIGQYFAQRIPASQQAAMSGCSAVTYRPGGYTGSFKGRTLLPANAAVKFIMSYEQSSSANNSPLKMPLKAYCADVHPSGLVEYGGDEPCLDLDLAKRPRAGAGGKTIDPERNPSLLETALRMDKTAQRAVAGAWRLPSEPLAPRVLLDFAANMLPGFQDTPALRQLAAQSLHLPVSELGCNGDVLLQRLLRDTWQQAFVVQSGPAERTGAAMIDARLCPGATGFLRAYEDFSELLGVPTWNPARDCQPVCCENPARQVLTDLGLGQSPDFDTPIADDLIDAMLQDMRQSLGDIAGRFSDEDLLDGITEPDELLVAWSAELPRLRASLPVWADECSEDEDLRRAVRCPAEPLWVRHACRIQVCRLAA